MRKDIHLEILSDPRLLQPVRGLVRGYLRALGYADDRVHEVVLAVDEACANAMRHSYEGRTDGVVTLNLRSNGVWMELELVDAGVPAPVEKTTRRKLEAPTIDTARPGGLGVQLMYEVFDEVRFCPGAERGNCVTMRLKQPPKKDS